MSDTNTPAEPPADLSEAQQDALIDAGNRALNDYYHERACSCDLWPDNCHTDPAYARGYWDTDAFAVGLGAVIGLWESMRADAEAARLRAEVAELKAAAERHAQVIQVIERACSKGYDPDRFELAEAAGIPADQVAS